MSCTFRSGGISGRRLRDVLPLQSGEKKLEPKKVQKPEPVKMIAGKSELLREIPKMFASYHGLEGDNAPTA
jgi:hypothetical protein